MLKKQEIIDKYKMHENNYIRHDNADSFNKFDRERASHHYCKMQNLKKLYKKIYGKDLPQ